MEGDSNLYEREVTIIQHSICMNMHVLGNNLIVDKKTKLNERGYVIYVPSWTSDKIGTMKKKELKCHIPNISSSHMRVFIECSKLVKINSFY